ncbi:Uncharacterised protein [Mycobacteroides abscessus subsp. abscessus]|nr:Uncharacterised protein [Mycobacteroides abscessus subsp. abscessus]
MPGGSAIRTVYEYALKCLIAGLPTGNSQTLKLR